MATRTRKNETKNTEEKKTIKVDSFKVTRAHEFENKNVAFDLELNGVNYYGLTVVKGRNGDFISFPQRKSGERYYSYYWIPFSDEDAEKIMDEVYNALD